MAWVPCTASEQPRTFMTCGRIGNAGVLGCDADPVVQGVYRYAQRVRVFQDVFKPASSTPESLHGLIASLDNSSGGVGQKGPKVHDEIRYQSAWEELTVDGASVESAPEARVKEVRRWARKVRETQPPNRRHARTTIPTFVVTYEVQASDSFDGHPRGDAREVGDGRFLPRYERVREHFVIQRHVLQTEARMDGDPIVDCKCKRSGRWSLLAGPRGSFSGTPLQRLSAILPKERPQNVPVGALHAARCVRSFTVPLSRQPRFVKRSTAQFAVVDRCTRTERSSRCG